MNSLFCFKIPSPICFGSTKKKNLLQTNNGVVSVLQPAKRSTAQQQVLFLSRNTRMVISYHADQTLSSARQLRLPTMQSLQQK